MDKISFPTLKSQQLMIKRLWSKSYADKFSCQLLKLYSTFFSSQSLTLPYQLLLISKCTKYQLKTSVAYFSFPYYLLDQVSILVTLHPTTKDPRKRVVYVLGRDGRRARELASCLLSYQTFCKIKNVQIIKIWVF